MKKDYFRTGVEDYLSRIQHFVPIEWVEVASEEKLIQRLPPGGLYIGLAVKGRSLTSEALAQKIQEWQNHSQKNIAFIIGNAFGLSENLLQQTHQQWSLSSFTLAHELAVLVLCEQVYRAFTILKGLPYHK